MNCLLRCFFFLVERWVRDLFRVNGRDSKWWVLVRVRVGFAWSSFGVVGVCGLSRRFFFIL